MKIIELRRKYSREDIISKLKEIHPSDKIKTPILANNAINIQNGTIATSIMIKDNIITVKGTVNFVHIGIALGVAIGTLLGIIGGFVFAGIIYFVKKNDFVKMENKYADLIKSHFL